MRNSYFEFARMSPCAQKNKSERLSGSEQEDVMFVMQNALKKRLFRDFTQLFYG